MKIAYVHSTYLEKRSFLFINKSCINFVRSPDVLKLCAHLGFKLFGKILPVTQNIYTGVSPYKYDVLHLFNGVSFSSKPWVTSFETKVPRIGRVPQYIEDIAVNRLAHESCKKIIALSKNAANIQRLYLENKYPHLAKKILCKLVVIPPPQKIFYEKKECKIDPKEKIIFTFVGRQFFRKGGEEVLRVFQSVCSKNTRCELNIVSLLEPDEYATHTNERDVDQIKKMLANSPKNIIHHFSLKNKDVMSLLKSSHVALLPTHADTYGFSVLEAQACGTPVITTDVRALSEINDKNSGWVIKVPKDENGNGFTSTENGRKKLKQVILEGLSFYVDDIMKKPEQIKNKAINSLLRVKNYHNPSKIEIDVCDVYDEVLNNK